MGKDFHFIRVSLLILSIPILFLALKLLVDEVDSTDYRPEIDRRREKRKARRVRSDAIFDLDDEAGNYSPGNAQLVDMSIWGICIASKVVMKEGQSIRGRIHSPTQVSHARIASSVRRCRLD
jgi:hypothetical protein